MHEGRPLQVAKFESVDNPLQTLVPTSQQKYIKAYLLGLKVVSVIVEHNYFDRDYLDEFAAYYSRSAKGYKNICKRVHFFTSEISDATVADALSGNASVLQEDYLGFSVLRPLRKSPFGRTVLAWYPNGDFLSERVTPKLRNYTCNILGIELAVDGIPWQQQDRGVSACATVALWSIFHSSAFDANHSIPTTVEITQNALGASSGARAFPSQGLSIDQLREAIYAQRLNPKILVGRQDEDGKIAGIDTGYLASMCAANIRSGYLVLLVGEYIHAPATQSHAICCIGFREKEQTAKPAGTFTTMDDDTDVFYVHDDNIGPNVRCRLIDQDGFGVLVTEAPDYIPADSTEPKEVFKFKPVMMLIAVHEEVRMDAESLVRQAARIASLTSALLNDAYDLAGLEKPALSYNAQFLDVRKFYKNHLPKVLSTNDVLSKVRISLGNDAPPLCLHIGLVSIGIVGAETQRLMDVIYDTTDSALECPVIASIVYDRGWEAIINQFPSELVIELFGSLISGYEL